MARSTGVGSSSGGIEASDAAAQATISASRPVRSARAWRITLAARSGGSGSADSAAHSTGDQQAHRRGDHEALVGRVEQHAGGGERVKGEEAGRGQKGQRNQEQASVGAPQRDPGCLEGERRARERRG